MFLAFCSPIFASCTTEPSLSDGYGGNPLGFRHALRGVLFVGSFAHAPTAVQGAWHHRTVSLKLPPSVECPGEPQNRLTGPADPGRPGAVRASQRTLRALAGLGALHVWRSFSSNDEAFQWLRRKALPPPHQPTAFGQPVANPGQACGTVPTKPGRSWSRP